MTVSTATSRVADMKMSDNSQGFCTFAEYEMDTNTQIVYCCGRHYGGGRVGLFAKQILKSIKVINNIENIDSIESIESIESRSRSCVGRKNYRERRRIAIHR
jgi:hypothetical protein